MNRVDLLIFLIVAACAVSGARRGLVGAGGEIAAVVLGLLGAAAGYPVLGALFSRFGLPNPLAPLLGFVVLAIVVVLLVGWGAGCLAERLNLPAKTNKAGGAALGGVTGVLLASVAVLVSGAITRDAVPVEQSLVGKPLVRLVPAVHETAERAGVPLPKLVMLPVDYREEVAGTRQGLQFLRINASKLDGAVCLHCRAPAKFEGYQLVKGTLMSPRYRCPKCGRTSDGCQTFEGFHAIYGVCPVDVANEGTLFDCGVWTNHWWTVPHGTCPVCGKEYRGPNLAAVDRGEVRPG